MANTTLKPPSASFFELYEKQIALLLCALAAIHVFIFSAGFPFFNNVDEGMHFDLVLRYAQGEVPGQIELISTNSGTYLGLMSSHEFYESAGEFPGGQYPAPLWTFPAGKTRALWAARSQIWESEYNYEVSQPPLYYVLGAFWWHVGQWIGLHGGRLVYWLRFLNIILVSALVWLAYTTAHLLFPDSRSDPLFLRLAVPACIAFMPQSAFYSIGNDVLSALCFGMTFYLLIQWLRAESLSAGLGASLGLAFAATYLSKMTNLPLLAITTVVVLLKAWKSIRRGKSRETVRGLGAFLFCAELPVIGWIAWCKAHYGDATGSAVKTHFLGWTIKPFAQWWYHPIFSPGGLWTYLSGQLDTFWQGELWWHGPRLCLPGTDTIYTLISLGLLAAALPALLLRSSDTAPGPGRALQLALACFIAELGFFGLMSIIYDYHNFHNPSREHPYFMAGRMMLGALIPFLLVFVFGLDRVLNRFGRTTKFVTLIAMVTAMVVLETATDRPAFASPYNWFHLPHSDRVDFN
ncbi:MAG TPA: DUF2142 domain-containing protein [Verrucomicrobiae bacterium]